MRFVKVISSVLLIVIFSFYVRSARCEEICIQCEVKKAKADIEKGNGENAVNRLKELVSANPQNSKLVLLLADAYRRTGNVFWAQNTLYMWLEEHPEDCEALSFLAWLEISQGNPEGAKEILATEGCPDSGLMETRWKLLLGYIDSIENSGDISLKGFKKAYPEDRKLWDTLWNKKVEGRVSPFEIRLNLFAGYTSNGSAGSPADSARESGKSAIGNFDLKSRFVYPTEKNVRPFLEGNLRMNGLLKSELQEYSYIDLSYRPGLMFGRKTKFSAAYRGDLLLLATPGKKKYYEAHRLELEFESRGGLLVFAGAGKRYFKENGRTRTEVDGGIGGSLRLNRWMSLMGALNGKYFNAAGDAYDQAGTGIITVAQVLLPKKMSFRSGLGGSLDFYFNSGGERGELAFGTTAKRRDFTVRQFDELWAPPFKNVQAGLSYEYNHRDSSADMNNGIISYDYVEHRVLLKIKIILKMNPFAPGAVNNKDHVEIDYEPGDKSDDNDTGGDSREIADLLREDEAARAASSCVD